MAILFSPPSCYVTITFFLLFLFTILLNDTFATAFCINKQKLSLILPRQNNNERYNTNNINQYQHNGPNKQQCIRIFNASPQTAQDAGENELRRSNNNNENNNNNKQKPPQRRQQAKGQRRPQSKQQRTSSNSNYSKRTYKNKTYKRKNYNNPKGRRQYNNNRNNNPGTMSPEENRKLNSKIVQQDNAQDVLNLLASTKGALTLNGGGGKLNSVNFSTAFHRVARHLQYSNNNQQQYNNNNNRQQQQQQNYNNNNNNNNIDGNNRSKILSDPRFALLAAGAAEALVGGKDVTDASNNPIVFRSREMSNMAWAIAKLKISPPQSVFPVTVSSNTPKLIKEKSAEVRAMVYEVAKTRKNTKSWIPALSELCGLILDMVSYRVIETQDYYYRSFQLQEWANLLWALATSQRAYDKTFQFVISSLIQGMDEADGIESLRPQEWSNSIWALATSSISGPENELIPYVAQLMDENPKVDFLDVFKPQELSNTAWGVATILSNKRSLQQQQQQQRDAVTGDDNDNDNDDEAKTVQAALTIIRHVAQQVIDREGNGFKTQELSNTAWAFATLGFGLSNNNNNNVGDSKRYDNSNNNSGRNSNSVTDYMILPSNDPKGDEELMIKAMNTIANSAKQIIYKFRSQELNNIAWAMARLDQGHDDDLLESIGLQISNPRRKVTPQDIGTTMWALASLEYVNNKDVYRGIAYRLSKERSSKWNFKPQELSNTLWALATAEVPPKFLDIFDTSLLRNPELRPSPYEAEQQDPVTICFAMGAQELMRRPFDFKTQEIKDILWSFSKAGVRHPQLFKSVAEHLVGSDDYHFGDNNASNDGSSSNTMIRGLKDFSPQGMGNLAWAYARQAQLADEVIARHPGKTSMSHSTGRLSVYTTSFVDIGEGLLKRLFAAIAEADVEVHDELSNLKPQDLSNTAWAFATLGMKHAKFLAAARMQLVSRTKLYLQDGKQRRRDVNTTFKGQEIANLLWAFATLNCPFYGLMTAVTPYIVDLCTDRTKGHPTVASIARFFKRQELANMAWACAVFGEYPKELIQILYMGLLGIGEKQDPEYVRIAHGDSGMEQSVIMSFIYLQIAMDLENPSNTFALPSDFPEGWAQNDSSSSSSPQQPAASAQGSGGGDDNNNKARDDYELTLNTSKIQRDVSGVFTRIGFKHVEEHVIRMDTLVEDYGIKMQPKRKEILSLDLANVQSKIGIEVDGPAHFVTQIDRDLSKEPSKSQLVIINGKYEYQFQWGDNSQEMNGPTSLKHRLLQQLGWSIIKIPFWEWYAMNGDSELEDKHCESLLETV